MLDKTHFKKIKLNFNYSAGSTVNSVGRVNKRFEQRGRKGSNIGSGSGSFIGAEQSRLSLLLLIYCHAHVLPIYVVKNEARTKQRTNHKYIFVVSEYTDLKKKKIETV